MSLQKIKRENWPETINLIAEVVGDDATIALLNRFSGRHLSIPKKYRDGHDIGEVIDKEKAQMLIDYFGGEMIIFPNCRWLMAKERNRSIIHDLAMNISVADLATKYQLTTRMIYKIIKESK